jgi:enoyl-CoA hydratase/carnithine racemase
VVTERSRIAMPEISVGLYPDVGGSWLLSRVPRNTGLFLALTGAPLNAADALFAGFADYCVAHAQKARLLESLASIHWGVTRAENDQLLGKLLRELGGDSPAPIGPLQENFNEIAALCVQENLEGIVAGILRLGAAETPHADHPWFQAAAKTLAAGSPGTARLSFTLQKRARHLSLAEGFRMEYIVSLHCATHTDFAEGIRALLIDKDRQPRWQPASLAEATPDWAAWFFENPWPADKHPLADL